MPASMTQIFLHYVWGTWQRNPWLVGSVREVALRVIAAKCAAAKSPVLALNGVADHVHLLVKFSPLIAPAKLIADAKGAASHAINQEWPHEIFKWQEGYGVFSVDEAGVARVQKYIANQQAHHDCQEVAALAPPSP